MQLDTKKTKIILCSKTNPIQFNINIDNKQITKKILKKLYMERGTLET